MLGQIGKIITKSSVITNRLSITMAALIIDYFSAPISQPYKFAIKWRNLRKPKRRMNTDEINGHLFKFKLYLFYFDHTETSTNL